MFFDVSSHIFHDMAPYITLLAEIINIRYRKIAMAPYFMYRITPNMVPYMVPYG